MSVAIRQIDLIEINPKLGAEMPAFLKFCRGTESKIHNSEHPVETVQLLRAEVTPQENPTTELLARLFASNVLLDLLEQGWKLKVRDTSVLVQPPSVTENGHASKESVRHWHVLRRDAQLSENSVIEFVKAMERRRLFRNQWHSIFSLMREGREIAAGIKSILGLQNDQERARALDQLITPYIQFVEPGAICEHTGLRLSDIWRYFRHTWVNEYKSIPGRSIMILVRDAASANHPVIGIAALGSSVVQHRKRDEWIGWDQQTFVRSMIEHPTIELIAWLENALQNLIDAIYVDDLISDQICDLRNIELPDDTVCEKLAKESERCMRLHHLNPQKHMHKGSERDLKSLEYWRKEALTHLYRSKRCKQLTRLLRIRKAFQTYGLQAAKSTLEKQVMEQIRMPIASLVRMIKAERVGINMMDITVCGAIAPYNLLLGGKLICMLLCSPEVTQYYHQRYQQQISIIASSMKGSPVVRKPKLALLVTTSLYGVGSSQYNRVRIPLGLFGNDEEGAIAYEDIGHSYGFGTYHFRKETIVLGSLFVSRLTGNRRVNSIFGEGVNPLMRKIREALDLVGLPSNEFLQHGNRRVTYGVKLAFNFREVLLGLDNEPQYLILQQDPSQKTKSIARYWRDRWLSVRIKRDDILKELAEHTLTYPIHHGAAVSLPTSERDLELNFDE